MTRLSQELEGSISTACVGYFRKQKAAGLIRPDAEEGPWAGVNPTGHYFKSVALTFDGWKLYEELLRSHVVSRTAFIAMKFGDGELNKIVRDCVAPAVRETGFELLNLQDSEKAGLIDDRIRVEIRRARFLLADLTHHSNGAYWEAGFAEGLGKPVIYLCRREVFEDKDNTTHFDTNHHLTIEPLAKLTVRGEFSARSAGDEGRRRPFLA